jgi:hypothetical protein
VAVEPLALAQAVLDDDHRLCAGTERRDGGDGSEGVGADLLDLERDDVDAAREVSGCVGVGEGRRDRATGDGARRTGGVGVQDMDVVP